MSAQTGFFLLFLILNCVAMFVFYRILRSRFSRNRVLDELRSEVDKLITDLGREADRDVALLESRILQLRALIDEADRRTVLSDKVVAKRQEAEKIMADIQAPVKESVSSNPSVISVPSQKVSETPIRDPITVYTRPMIQRSEKQVEPFVPLYERVLDMARKGISPEMIASTLSISLGEVELILDMNSSSL